MSSEPSGRSSISYGRRSTMNMRGPVGRDRVLLVTHLASFTLALGPAGRLIAVGSPQAVDGPIVAGQKQPLVTAPLVCRQGFS